MLGQGCLLGAELTLHVSWVHSRSDLRLVPNLGRLAAAIAPVAKGCVAEILLTLDTVDKVPGAADAAARSDLGQRLRAELGEAAADAATRLAAPDRGGPKPLVRLAPVNYSNPTVLRLALGVVLGLPRRRFRQAIQHLAKHTMSHAYALALCRTEYLLHFDSDIALSPDTGGQWLHAAAGFLRNSTWLPGLFAVSAEECAAHYPPGTLDLVVPLRADVADEYRGYTKAASKCVRTSGKMAPLVYYAPGDASLSLCLVLCSQRQLSCTGAEWHEDGRGPRGDLGGRRCFHMQDVDVTLRIFLPFPWSETACYIKEGPGIAPPLTFGNLYLRYHHYSARGPHFSMRAFVMRLPRFRAVWPLLSDRHALWWEMVGSVTRMAQPKNSPSEALWQEYIETFVELRLVRPADQGSEPHLRNLPSFAAFLAPGSVGGACVCELGKRCPLDLDPAPSSTDG